MREEGKDDVDTGSDEEDMEDAFEVTDVTEGNSFHSMDSTFGEPCLNTSLLPAWGKSRQLAARRIGVLTPGMRNCADNKAPVGNSALASAAAIAAAAPQSLAFFDDMMEELSKYKQDNEEDNFEGHKRYNYVCVNTARILCSKRMKPGMFRPLSPLEEEAFQYIASRSLLWAYRYKTTVCHGFFLTVFSWPSYDIIKDPNSRLVFYLSSYPSIGEGCVYDAETQMWNGSFMTG